MTDVHSPARHVPEATIDELATQRYLFDLALQPLETFDGFTRLEQIGGSARCVINSTMLVTPLRSRSSPAPPRSRATWPKRRPT